MSEPRVIVRWIMRGWQDFTLAEARARFSDAPDTNDACVWAAWLARRTPDDQANWLNLVEWDGIASDSTTIIELNALDLSHCD